MNAAIETKSNGTIYPKKITNKRDLYEQKKKTLIQCGSGGNAKSQHQDESNKTVSSLRTCGEKLYCKH